MMTLASDAVARRASLSHLMHESVRRGCKVASVGRRDKMATPAVQKEGKKGAGGAVQASKRSRNKDLTDFPSEKVICPLE